MSAKSVKDKAFGGSPRLVPRHTAASAARAALNASNRNLPAQRSPSRASAPSSPANLRNKPQIRKSDSKSDFKANPRENDRPLPIEDECVKCDSYVIEETATAPVVAEDVVEQRIIEECRLQEISENDVFEIVKDEPQILLLHQEEENDAPKAELPRSRPQTPSKAIRPPTPRSMPSSRPQTPTPRFSRPSTPAHPHRYGTPASRPNTPRSSRPITPASVPVPVLAPTEQPVSQNEDVKSAYELKEKEFQTLKKDLDLKQQAILDVFDAMLRLRDRMTSEGDSGCGEGSVQELVVFNVADWTAQEVRQLCQDAAASAATDGAAELINTTVMIDEHALEDLDANVLSVPHRFADLCLQAYTTRQEIIDWVKGLIEHNLVKDDNGDGECLERISRYNAQGLELCESLQLIKNHADNAINTISQLSRRACRERNALIAVGESLVREVARLRQDIETKLNMVTVVSSTPTPEVIPEKISEESQRASQQEKSMQVVKENKEKLATTESQLRQARVRITKMDRQLREAEASIFSLTANVKSLEDQSRQREVQLEARARKLKESLKTGEVANGHLAQQREALQTQVKDLRDQLEQVGMQHKVALQEMTNQINDVKDMLQEEKHLVEKEREAKMVIQATLGECQNGNEDLKKIIKDMERAKANPEFPSEREMEMWSELQAVKDTLKITEEEVLLAKREKVRFLESFTKIAESENKIGLQQRLAAELLSKEEIMAKMQAQIRDLLKNVKLNEQKVLQYEKYVKDLQDHFNTNSNSKENPNSLNYQELQREINNLKMNLLEAAHQNEELSERLVQREQHIEQQDKTSRAQVREELINMLKNKETEQSRELMELQQDLEHRMKIVDEVNKQIASKAEEIHELFSTLESKQQQIHRLEKIVLALEEQQRRAQAQRTRHEEKIAMLEHDLAACGNRRERKFLFF